MISICSAIVQVATSEAACRSHCLVCPTFPHPLSVGNCLSLEMYVLLGALITAIAQEPGEVVKIKNHVNKIQYKDCTYITIYFNISFVRTIVIIIFLMMIKFSCRSCLFYHHKRTLWSCWVNRLYFTSYYGYTISSNKACIALLIIFVGGLQ